MSDSSSYQPVSCALHSQLELLAMQRKTCSVRFTQHNVETGISGIIRDILIRNKAEFVLIESAGGQIHEIRLDNLLHIE